MDSARKKKLTIDEQVAHMKERGIQFNIVSEEQAEKFLLKNNYYFKLKAYAKNYEKYYHGENEGKYKDLEFAYLQELSTIDMHFRCFIIETCLSIEHALKVRLLNDCSEQVSEDGYKIIEEFYTTDSDIKSNIKMKKMSSTCRDLIEKYEDNFALWNIVEVLSFGDFIKLYQLYYEKYEDKTSLSHMVFPMKLLRNAAAHNNCLLHSLVRPYSIGINANEKLNRAISKAPGIGKREMRKKMRTPVIHDFVLLLYIFDKIVESEGTRFRTYEKLRWLVNERMLQHKDYFLQNEILVTSYKFIKKIVDFFAENSIQ